MTTAPTSLFFHAFLALGVGLFAMNVSPDVRAEAPPTFERIAYPMPERTDGAVVLDVDGDGDRDLVAICRQQVIAVLLPEGETRTLYRSLSGGMIHGTTWDADADGDLDIAVCRFQSGEDFTVAWLENPGWEVHALDNELNGTHGVATGDLDGDGADDLVAANVMGAHPKSVAWFAAKTGERGFVAPEEAGGRPHYMDTGDVDGDGHIDVALGAGNGFTLFSGPDWEPTRIDDQRGGTNVIMTDFLGNGKLDILASCGHGTGIFWYSNGDWVRHPVDPEFTDVHALDAGDLDNDGDIDVVAASFGGYQENNEDRKRVHWYENTGGGIFQRHELDVDNEQESYSLVIEDVDGDGARDVVLGGRSSNNIVWYRNLLTNP